MAESTLQIVEQRSALTEPLQNYQGLVVKHSYLAQVDLAALHSGWSHEETAIHLVLALEGAALQVLVDLASGELCDLQAITAALDRRFRQRISSDQSREQLISRQRGDGESLGAHAAYIQLYTGRGYPSFLGDTIEELSLHNFLRGLTPEPLHQHVRLSFPATLS